MLSLTYRTYRCKITAMLKGFIFKTKLWNGQGFAIDETRIMTNQHVIGQTADNMAYLINGKKLQIKAIHTAAETLGTTDDLAVIEFAEPHGLPVIRFATTAPAVGEKLIFINQHGTFKVAKLHFVGDVASLYYALADSPCVDGFDRDSKFYDILKEDAHWRGKGNKRPPIYYTGLLVQPGDSGGPVFNEAGEVVGAIFAESTITYQGLVCPLETVKAMAALVQLR